MIGKVFEQNTCYSQVSFSGCYISGALIDPGSTVGCGNSGTNNYCNLASLFVPAFSPTACATSTTSGGVSHAKATVYSLPAGCTATIQAEFRKRNYLGVGATATGCSNCGMDALPDALSINQSGGVVSAQGSTLDVNVGTCGAYPTLGTYTTSTASISGGCSNADGYVNMILTGGTFTIGGASNRADEIITFTINLSGTCGPACSNVLPIELISFYGNTEKGKVKLTWKIASEQNVNYYLIEKSIDGENWNFLHKQKPWKAEGGNNITYTTQDHFPEKGINYYRLRNFDKDGSVGDPHLIAVDFNRENEIFYQEQSDRELILHIQNTSAMNSECFLTDMNGKTVKKFSLNPGNNTLIIEKYSVPPGIYGLYAENFNSGLREKIIVH